MKYNAVACPAVLLVAWLACDAAAVAATQDIVNCDGYPCVNFAFGANVSREGDLFASTFYNPPRLGAGLEPLGGGELKLAGAGGEMSLRDCQQIRVTRLWPLVRIVASDPRLDGLSLSVEACCPNAGDDAFTGTLPVAMATIDVKNSGDAPRQLQLRYEGGTFIKTDGKPLVAASVKGVVAGSDFVAWVDPAFDAAARSDDELTLQIVVSPGETARCRLVIGHWDEGYPSSARLHDPAALAAHVGRFWDTLFAATKRLEQRLPATGDQQVDQYLRWYLTAGVAMTRVMKDGTALTMGYHELNQRDSFWTTWAHLVLWQTLERRMIEESVWGQRADGKVPTTILPVIERDEDVDINCYFILRALRYARFHGDDEFGRRVLPSLELAAEWLAARDTTGNGLPRQTSYWNDWKDVPGMEGRAYSPYASMLYVAAMQRLGDYCAHLGETERGSRYHQLAAGGGQTLNKPVAEGGLYNGRYYEHLWDKPRDDQQHVSEDQVVGIVFDVIPQPARQTVLDALRPSLTAWGVRDTYPFFGGGFGYEGGDYHNGGIWPYLNHVHAWALFHAGRQEEGLELLRRVGHADLVMAGDYIPHEYLHGQTGRQAGVPMQGWNAAMFGAVYFGYAGRDVP